MLSARRGGWQASGASRIERRGNDHWVQIMRKLINALLATSMLVFIPIDVEAQGKNDKGDSVKEVLGRAKEMLVKGFKPRLPAQNGLPSLAQRFVPIEFDSCNLKWQLVARSGRTSYITQASLNLADFDPTPPFVLMVNMPRTDRWGFEMRTMNEERKIKVEWIVTNGPRVIDKRVYFSSHAGFGGDSQEVTQKIADDVFYAIKQCSETN
jgi:hypothetical protein